MKTHFKKLFNPNYLGVYSLNPDQEITLTIKKMVQEMVTSEGGRQEECLVTYFDEKVNGSDKGMITNTTNCKRIAKLYGTPYIEDWIGKKIILHSELVKYKGETTDGLRVKEELPYMVTQEDIDIVVDAVNNIVSITELNKYFKSISTTLQQDKTILAAFKKRKDEL